MHRLLIVIGFVALAGCMATEDAAPRRGGDDCHIVGCSGQVCSDTEDVFTSCEWIDAYECYRSATCARQRDGACGWTPTTELNACLATHAL
jgi:eight-cysteine-cluster-containing protein